MHGPVFRGKAREGTVELRTSSSSIGSSKNLLMDTSSLMPCSDHGLNQCLYTVSLQDMNSHTL